ncbi:MAG: magnesium transporter [Proteobacteria bacterium]|nr:magnesium transporter [Pseudomonadota bacterium]
MTPHNPPNYRFADTLKRLLRRNAVPNIRKILERTHPVDVAHVLDSFIPPERLKILSYIGDDARQAEAVACMPLALAVDLLNEISLQRAVALLHEMSGDDRADILGALDEDLAGKIMTAMPDEESDEVADLLRYGESTAGGIMSPDFLAISEDVTAGDAIGIVQDSPDVEMAFYIYVVNKHGSLVGIVSLRQLVTSRRDALLHDIMNPHVVSVRTDEDQEEVARLVSRYDLLAVPVVEEPNRLVGVVTVDDVIDVIREEATEDILKMAGVGDEWDDTHSVLSSVKRRAPWLAAAWFGGIIASFVIGHFQGTLQKYMPLVAFIPIIIGMAGNVGTQSLTVIVRGLATRRIDIKKFWSLTSREVAVGVLLGVLYGAALGAMGFLQLGSDARITAVSFAAVIGVSAAVAMTIAALVGAATPLMFARLHIDPAVATGPFVTTTIDVIGVLVYFNLARLLI